MLPKTALLSVTYCLGRGDHAGAINALLGYFQGRVEFGIESPMMPNGEDGDAYARREGRRLAAVIANAAGPAYRSVIGEVA